MGSGLARSPECVKVPQMNAAFLWLARRLMKLSTRRLCGDAGARFSRAILYLIVTPMVVGVPVRAEERPFPENRVRHFYRDQARQYLESKPPRPSMLRPFPGLDGGAWGHWGQNPESDNADTRLNEVDFGGLLMQVTQVGGREFTKGVNVRAGKFTAVFDPEQLCFVSAWRGDMVLWSAARYGITAGVRASGPILPSWNQPPSWGGLLETEDHEYHGFYRRGEEVIFAYRIGESEIRESVRDLNGELHRVLLIQGTVSSEFDGPPTIFGRARFEGQEMAGPARWAKQVVKTNGKLGRRQPGSPFVIDTLTVPYRDANPFKTPMRIGGVDALPDGRLAVSTLMGDVWVVDGVDDKLSNLTWRRYASGLNQPLGLRVRDGDIFVIGRDQLTRLHDLNDDGEADFYECVTHDFPTKGGNSFALSLHQDDKGAFYWFTRSEGFGVTRFHPEEPDGRPVSTATGLRGTNGLAVSPDGKIVLAMPQEGDWQPASGIFEVGNGSFHGHGGPQPALGKYGYELPLCFIPRGVDNSSGDAAFLPQDRRLGPLSGRMIGTSFGYAQHYLILREEMKEGVQGGVMPLPGDFLSGAHRVSFNELDGHLYVAGTDGWQSYAKENGSLQRLRYTGGSWPLPEQVETHGNGLVVRFNEVIDPSSVQLEKVFAQQWNYLYSGAYGSQEYSVKSPGVPGHDPVVIKSVHALPDRRSVFVEIPHLHPVMQFHLYMELKTAGGQRFTPDLYYSIFEMKPNFTQFRGYEQVEKEAWNDFPSIKDQPVDPRLLAQEGKGKILGDEAQLSAVPKLRVATIAGLKFAPERLRVTAGSRATLTVTNEDPSMPHNLVLLHPEALREVGEASMKMAATPEGVAKHYVMDHDGVIAFSPILQSGGQYTIYFDAPEEPGEYPYVCTYPGHWQVTRGVLDVVVE